MYQNGIVTLCLFLIFSTLMSCSSTDKISSADANNGIAPIWYQSSGFESDSTNYSGFATAVAADSVLAIERAKKQARAELENHIAQKLELIRTQLEEDGSLNAIDPEFILTLRTSHASVEGEAEISNATAVYVNSYYRGFAKASIKRASLFSLLENGFKNNLKLWEEFSSSEYFASELK